MPLDPAELRARLAGQRWTAHNIRLTADLTTIEGVPDFASTNLHWLAIERLLDTLYHGRLEGLRVADLGCNEGGFSLALAKRGAEVVGMEAREENVAKCRLLADHFALPKLSFVQGDVKDLRAGTHGTFDVVLALGILYHLDDPVAWLQQVGAATRAVLYVDTHFAPPGGADLGALEEGLAGRVGPLETRSADGWDYEGRWFHEYNGDAERDAMPWAAFSNPDSFWLTKRSLLRAVHRAGFSSVLEQHEHNMRWLDRFTLSFPRCMVVGLKTGAFR